MPAKKKAPAKKKKPRITGAGARRDARIEAALNKGKEGGGSRKKRK